MAAEAVVEFDYDAEQDDELTLRVGDVIKGVITADGGWWEGELNGKKGMFPENFVKLKAKETKKEEKREATQRKSVRELANKFKDGVPLPGSQGSVIHKKKDSTKKKCKVMFDYKPENEDELELQNGQSIDFIREVEEGWWEGAVNGKTGVFPSNFVELEEGEPSESEGTKAAGSGEKDGDFQEIKGKKIMGIGLGNIFEGGPIKLRNTKKGPPPPGGKHDQDPVPPAKAPDVTKREKPNTKASTATEKAVVRYSYTAEQPDELSLKEGEVINILDTHLEDEGWWKGEVNGKVGVFPDNFVELIPIQEETSKAPKKPPPPVGKNLYPKLPEKQQSVLEEKTSSSKKDQEVVPNIQPAPVAASKKPMAPPVGKKPGGPGQPPGKPDPPKLTETAKVEMRSKESNNHQAQVPTDSNKVQDQEDANFDALESSSQKLVHLTASRAKGPKKRPPSTVLFPTDVEKAGSDGDEGKDRGNNHVQPEKPPPPVNIPSTKDQKHILAMDVDRKHDTHAVREPLLDRNAHAPPRPPEPFKHLDISSDASAQLHRLVEDLQREVRDLRSNTVSKNEYNDQRSEYLRLKQEFETFKTSHGKKLRDLMLEVDEEKKLRLNTQVEMERVKKLVAESHV